MKDFKDLADNLVSKIDDPLERKASSEELYSHMLDMYDDLIADNLDMDEAVSRVLNNFNNTYVLKDLYRFAHINHLNKNKVILFIILTFIVFILLYALIYSMFA